ncbi:hypothetical protein EJ066_07080 [Mesorhizobium sp. M9A.F.Ca.ET.002.03.1.2]|uniref:hypothetical protein n=1 Tax=Mesorhizobium sp. M9A.F.Ca.ET.002.03.1.2 TaxID=2493668 RepID=UPI000F763225|nr:hypothetical protein [Mesorhizobium sp. M9A.F.Ca.ET.002.03.1.2]AZN97072.1 hypothetical protein EJ066_07080 [Mesorhizobium sp. M9A.F.Ca.ET.002.03.1.2]
MFQNTAWARKKSPVQKHWRLAVLSGNRRKSTRFGLSRCTGLPVSCRKVYAGPRDSHTGCVGKQHFLDFMLLYYKSISILREE